MMSYDKNIVEIKNEYTTFITNIITPSIFEGIKSLYTKSLDIHNKFVEQNLRNPGIEQSPGVLKIFQTCLKDIPSLNRNAIERESERIRVSCKCSEWFDDLIKAVIKSNIILLTFNNSRYKDLDILKQKHHERVDTNDFIHKCYIESARIIYNNPELFWHEFPTLEIKRNQRDACDLIKIAVKEAIRKMLPMKLILQEYLLNDFENVGESNIQQSQYINIKSMVDRDLGHNYKALETEAPNENVKTDSNIGFKGANDNDNPNDEIKGLNVDSMHVKNIDMKGGEEIFNALDKDEHKSEDVDNFFEEIGDGLDNVGLEPENNKVIFDDQPLDILKGKLDELSNKIEPPKKMSKTGLELQKAVDEFTKRNKNEFFSKYYT